jgi:hypothetical protein
MAASSSPVPSWTVATCFGAGGPVCDAKLPKASNPKNTRMHFMAVEYSTQRVTASADRKKCSHQNRNLVRQELQSKQQVSGHDFFGTEEQNK